MRPTFRNLAPGHWVNLETGVELARGANLIEGSRRWYVAVPDRSKDGRRLVTVRDSLAAARSYAASVAVPDMRAAIAHAYEDATAPAEAPAPTAPATTAKAAPPLVFRRAPVISPAWTQYASTDGNYRIIGVPVAGWTGSAINPDRAFTPYRNGVKVGPAHRRLSDAKEAAQRHAEDVAKAHNSALLDEAARRVGDPDWRDASSGQQMLAVAEDIRRSTELRARAGTGPRQLSGWGRLAAAHRGALGS